MTLHMGPFRVVFRPNVVVAGMAFSMGRLLVLRSLRNRSLMARPLVKPPMTTVNDKLGPVLATIPTACPTGPRFSALGRIGTTVTLVPPVHLVALLSRNFGALTMPMVLLLLSSFPLRPVLFRGLRPLKLIPWLWCLRF